jgi:branched-chain amino acid transport system substrate-binding protein
VVSVILVLASLAGGSYIGYQSGYDKARQQLEPELQKQININANITKQNEALNKALYHASNLNTVKIGYIAPDPTDKELSGTLIEDIIQPDLNAYASKLGYNVTFQFVIKTVLNGQPMDHQEKVQELNEIGVDLVISGGWSSMLDLSFGYATDNDMLLVGTASTSPLLSIPNDRLYRMIPPDSTLPNSLASIMWSYGIKNVIILYRSDSYGTGLVNLFKPAWAVRGGEFAGEAISYPVDTTDFSNYLEAANLQAQAAKEKYPEGDRVGILLLSLEEDALIVPKMGNYLPLYDCVMFSGFSHIGLKMLDYFIGSPQASHLRVFTPSAQPFRSSIIEGLKDRYPSGASYLDDQGAYLYDAAWAIAISVLETRSVNASVVAGVFPDVCSRLYGASGWCRLDQSGDRAPLPLDVWFYSQNSRLYAGIYYPGTDTMNWHSGELGYMPPGP